MWTPLLIVPVPIPIPGPYLATMSMISCMDLWMNTYWACKSENGYYAQSRESIGIMAIPPYTSEYFGLVKYFTGLRRKLYRQRCIIPFRMKYLANFQLYLFKNYWGPLPVPSHPKIEI
jgi:hypothetical protein